MTVSLARLLAPKLRADIDLYNRAQAFANDYNLVTIHIIISPWSIAMAICDDYPIGVDTEDMTNDQMIDNIVMVLRDYPDAKVRSDGNT